METLYRAGLCNAVSATLLALVVACLTRVLARRPAVLHCLWLLVLLKLVTPPLYEISIPWPEAPAPRVVGREIEAPLAIHFDDNVVELDAGATVPDGNPPPPAMSSPDAWPAIDWMRLACLIWVAGTVTTLVVSWVRIRRFQHIVRESRPADQDTQAWVDDLAATLGVERSPSVLWTDGKVPPLIWYLGGRPRMIIPSTLWNGLGELEQSTLVIHELAHLRRGDHLVRILELVVTAIYWWHPFVWWARQALRDVEEQCCDAWVVWACPGAAKSYAETLLETLDFLNQSDLSEPLLASGFGRVHHLRKRLTMIMSGNTPRLLGLSGTLAALGLGITLLPLNASWAQKADERREIKVVVTNDGETTQAIESVAGPEGDTVTASASTIGSQTPPGQLRVEVKTDDSPVSVVASSVDEAIKKIKEQLDKISKEASPSDKVVAKKKALERVVKDLEGLARREKEAKSDGDRKKVMRDLTKIRLPEAREISPETKAEIDKITAQVKKLQDELRSKQNELRSKQDELVEARRKLARLTATVRVLGPVVTIQGAPDKEKMKLDVKVRELAPLAKKPVLERPVVRRDGDAGQKRIDELEKKLEKLLDEVASLKKDRAK